MVKRRKMTNPRRHVVWGEEEVRATEARYAVLEAESQAMYLSNERLMCDLREHEEIVATEWLWVD